MKGVGRGGRKRGGKAGAKGITESADCSSDPDQSAGGFAAPLKLCPMLCPKCIVFP